MKYFLALAAVIGLYLVSHFAGLTAIPIFADEAIYIRWAQLIIDDSQQYLYFALNDGKTPLFIWFITPFLHLFDDQLFAARFASVIIGFFQVLILGWISSRLFASRIATVWTMLLATILPFWYFLHRMALMDGLLVLLLSISFGLTIELFQIFSHSRIQKQLAKTAPFIFLFQSFFTPKAIFVCIALAVSLFLAIWTKLPAVLGIPALFVFSLLQVNLKNRSGYAPLLGILVSTIVSVGFFLLLFFYLPAFPQLFSRGGDFLYSLSDFISGKWIVIFSNSAEMLNSLLQYLTPLVVISPIIGLLLQKYRKLHFSLLLGCIVYLLPMALLAKVLYPRYYLFSSVFLVLSSALVVREMLDRVRNSSFRKKAFLAIGLALYVANILSYSLQWQFVAISDPNNLPMTKIDRMQYFEEWSSGHGIFEVIALLEEAAKTQRIAVATEGYFGTLPDAMLVYLHTKDVNNIAVDGIGQPVHEIPDWFIEKSQLADQVWLLVNSHRLFLNLEDDALIAEFCRPNNAPCLQLWNITDYSAM